MNKRPIAAILIITFMVLGLIFVARLVRENLASPRTESPLVYLINTPSPTNPPLQLLLPDDNKDPAYAAAQSTLDYNQRQLVELSIQGTEISQNNDKAAATQQFITEQTQMAWDIQATAQSQAATATYSAYVLNVTQAAQAQAILDFHVVETAQANATLDAYRLTATPWAALQAEITRAQNESDLRDWWGSYVVTPIKIILVTVVAILLIAGGVKAYLWFMLGLRLRTILPNNDNPLLLVDGTIVEPGPPYYQPKKAASHRPNPVQPASDGTPQVESIAPSDASIINWISEAEQELRKLEGNNHEF